MHEINYPSGRSGSKGRPVARKVGISADGSASLHGCTASKAVHPRNVREPSQEPLSDLPDKTGASSGAGGPRHSRIYVPREAPCSLAAPQSVLTSTNVSLLRSTAAPPVDFSGKGIDCEINVRWRVRTM